MIPADVSAGIGKEAELFLIIEKRTT